MENHHIFLFAKYQLIYFYEAIFSIAIFVGLSEGSPAHPHGFDTEAWSMAAASVASPSPPLHGAARPQEPQEVTWATGGRMQQEKFGLLGKIYRKAIEKPHISRENRWFSVKKIPSSNSVNQEKRWNTYGKNGTIVISGRLDRRI